MRKRQLCLPLLHEQGVLWQGYEADDLTIVLPNSSAALAAALSMREAIDAFNASLGESEQHFRIDLSCIAVHSGTPVLADKNRLYGPVFEVRAPFAAALSAFDPRPLSPIPPLLRSPQSKKPCRSCRTPQVAYELAELTGDSNTILITDRVKGEIDEAALTILPTRFVNEKVPNAFFAVSRAGPPPVPPSTLLVPSDDTTFLSSSLAKLARRFA